MGGAWPEQPLLVFAETGGGTTARRQRYHRSTKAEKRQEPAVQPLGRALQPLGKHSRSQTKREALSLTPEEDKRGVMEVYVNGFPYSFQCGFPLDSTGSLRPKR